MNLDDPQDRSVAAGEYVLGTLEAQARDALERRLSGDAVLQAEVYAWQDRLLGLTRKVAPAEPAPHVWTGIEAGLGQAGRAAGSAAPAANDPLWRRLRRWQLVGGLAIAAALVLSSLLVLRAPTGVQGERYLAVLQAPDSKVAGWVVEATEGGSVRLVPVGPGTEVPPGKALQFWTKAEGAAGPTSLGLVKPGQVTELPAGKLPVLEARQLFELTLEPETGSPIGRPTGPILYVGTSVRI